MKTKPERPADFPLFAHSNGQWAKKIAGKLVYFGPWDNPDGALAKFRGQDDTRDYSHDTRKLAAHPQAGKPHDAYPLFRHSSGQWAKSVRGKMYYFGTDADAALQRWLDEKDAILGGRVRRMEGATVKDLLNRFLNAKLRAIATGELEQRTFEDYKSVGEKIVAVLGSVRLEDISTDDFERLRTSFATGKRGKAVGPVTLGSLVNRARTIFNFACPTFLKHPLQYGKSFCKPSKKALRKARKDRGKKLFSAAEIHAALGKASPQMKAMILLGINCGLGNNDCAMLTAADIHCEWLNYARPKTGIDRRSYLWPETREAIAAIKRPQPKDKGHDDRVFITRYGFPWEPKAKSGGDSPITKEMDKLLRAAGIKRPGLSFCALRHTTQTIAEKTLDKDAVRYIMGQAEGRNGTSAVYSEEAPSDERLKAVAEYVREWLYKPASVTENADAT